MDVPEIMLYEVVLLSPAYSEKGATGDHAASMLTPGAVKSGCSSRAPSAIASGMAIINQNAWEEAGTFNMFLVIGLGPLEENETTTGAVVSFSAVVFGMSAVGLL